MSRRFYLIGSTLLLLSVGLMLWMNALGFTINLYRQWWSFVGFNLLMLILFVPPLASNRWPASEKRVLGLWLLFAVWYEMISFSAGPIRALLYVVGFLVSGLALYYAARINNETSDRT